MATSIIQLKRSSVALSVPLVGDLSIAEQAFNTSDNSLYISNGSSVIKINHSSNIEETTTKKFVSDIQIAGWDAKLNTTGGVISGSISFSGTANPTLALDGDITLGSTSSLNVSLGTSTLQARSNGTASSMNINPLGGTVNLGNSTSDTVINGNLIVNGLTTTINTQTIALSDNIIVLNSDEVGTPSQDGGIEVERGTLTNSRVYWDETLDEWRLDSAGTTSTILHSASTVNASTLNNIPSSGYARRSWSIKTSAYTATSGDAIAVDTSSSAITITLPASSTLGDTISIVDAASSFASNNLTVARNGSLLLGLASDLVLSANGGSLELVYVSSLLGWTKI